MYVRPHHGSVLYHRRGKRERQGKARQVYLYGTFHTQRQFNVLYINKAKGKMKTKDTRVKNNKDKTTKEKKVQNT